MNKRENIKTQMITTAAGEKLAVLPWAEYEALRDSADAAHAKKTIAAITRGDQDTFTPDEALAYAHALTPLQFWRKKRKMSQVALAAKCDISQSYVAALENGTRKGDPVHFKRLAAALHVCIEDLIED